jgi:multiple sugar transport system permease protein
MNAAIKPQKTGGLSSRKRFYNFLSYAALILLALFFLFPLVFMFMSAFKSDESQLIRDLSSVKAFLPTGEMSFQNFNDVFARFNVNVGSADYRKIFFNSSFVVSIIVVLGLIINSSFAYALARIPFWGRNALIIMIVSLIIIPFQAVAIPLMLITYQFKLANTYVGLIIPFIAHAFSIYLFYQFFIGLPKELEEAAVVDGASRFRIYWSIVLPLSGPVLQNPDLFTLPLAMQTFFGQAPRQWGDIMAFTVMATLPTLIVFLVFQRYFVRSAVSSGVKG